MKHTMIPYIIGIFIGLLLVALGILLTVHHSNTVARIATVQPDYFDHYKFAMPDGEILIPATSIELVCT